MSENYKVACIGTGASGTGHLLLMENYHPGSVVAFCDLDRSTFDAIVEAYLAGARVGGTEQYTVQAELRPDFRDLPFYTDPDEMFAKEDIDTVVIASYCASHAEMIEKCVKQNVNILLEKPIATTEEDVEKVWRLLKDYPKVVTVNFTMRGAPVSVAARRHVRNGDIGKIVSVQYVNNVHYGDGYFRGWMRTRDKIGSLLLQKATHDLDIINDVTGLRPVSIAAFGSRLVYGGDMPNDLTCDECDRKETCPMSIYVRQIEAALPPPASKRRRKCVYAKEIDVDDNQVLIIQYEGGVTASYSQTFNAPTQGGQRGGYFIGTEGIMALWYYGEFVQGPAGQIAAGSSHIDITRRNAPPGTKIHEVYDWAGRSHFDGTERTFMGKLDLLAGRPSEVAGTIREGYVSAKMCLAAQRSIEEKRVIPLDLQ